MNRLKKPDTKKTHASAQAERPNFVFILADDLGYSDLHCYGGREDCSPNLDKMATEGLLFTNGYAGRSGGFRREMKTNVDEADRT